MTRIAICGLGNIGKVHLRNLRTLRGCAVVGAYDPAAPSDDDFQREAGLHRYPSLDDLFADPAVDAVVIATPSETHRALTEAALRAGKHVFLEKPLAGTLEEAQAIVDAAARHPRLVAQAGFCERSNPQFIEAKRAVDAGTLGDLRCIHSSRVSPLSINNPQWQLGALDTAVHNLDLILWLLADMPKRVLARGVRLYPGQEILHSVTTLLEFRGGRLVTDTITWLSDDAHPLSACARARMQVMGTEGTFSVDLSSRPSSLLTRHGYREIDTVLLGADEYPGCLKFQFEGFLRAIEEGAPVPAPLPDALRAEQVVLAAQQSLITGDWTVLS